MPSNCQSLLLGNEPDKSLPGPSPSPYDPYPYANRSGEISHSYRIATPDTIHSIGGAHSDDAIASAFTSASASTHPDQGYKLLSFSPRAQPRTLGDDAGQIGCANLSATLHGNFFTAGSEDASIGQLTCYRRNIFGVSGTITLPNIITDSLDDEGVKEPVTGAEVYVEVVESTEGRAVELIHVPLRPVGGGIGPTEESAVTVPLSINADSGQSFEAQPAQRMFPFEWKRLQFRSSTANNGRRKGLQQQFRIQVKFAVITSKGTKLAAAEVESSPIVVRGRNPGNFISDKSSPGHFASSMGNTRANSFLEMPMHIPMAAHGSTVGTVFEQHTNLDLYGDADSHQYYVQNSIQHTSAGPYDWAELYNLATSGQGQGRSQSQPHIRNLSPHDFQTTSCAQSHQNSPTMTPAHSDIISHASEESSQPFAGQLSFYYPLLHQTSNQPELGGAMAHQTYYNNIKVPSSTTSTPGERQSGRNTSDEPMYEYFPLGLNGWMPPVDAVYRPHVAHNTVLAPELKGLAIK